MIYALPESCDAVQLVLPPGSTVADAIKASGIAHSAGQKFGIYGKVVTAETPLADGDRVELYRPLALDPKEARRRRARRKLG